MSLFRREPSAQQARSWIPEPPLAGTGALSAARFSNPLRGDAESSLRKVAVFASVNLLAGLVGQLPIDGYAGVGQSRRTVVLPDFFTDPDGSGHGMSDWLYQLMFSWLLRGNAYGRVAQRDVFGRPTVIVLLHPDTVRRVTHTDGTFEWWVSGVKVDDPADIWHRRAYPVPGVPLGLSPISLHALTIGQGLAAAQFGMQWFLDGGHPSAILQNGEAAAIKEEQARTVKARFLSAVRGTREPVVLGSGWTYTPIQIAPNESQFLDAQGYTSAECARIYGPGLPEVLGYATGNTMTYANVEQRSIDLLKFALDRWLVAVERMLSRDVMSNPRYVKFNRNALLQTDLLTRYQAHAIAVDKRILNPNEVRGIEDWPIAPWGDEPAPWRYPSTNVGATDGPGGIPVTGDIEGAGT